MSNVSRSSLALLLVSIVCVGSARADALPSCEPGTHMVMNPSTPGSGHHGGAFCAPNEPPVNPLPDGTMPPVVAPTTAPAPVVATPPVDHGEGSAPAAAPAAAPASSSFCAVAHHGEGGAGSALTLLFVVGLALLRRR